MRVEHALLDRLEKRSLQIAQMKREIHGLQQLRDEKMAINEQLAEQITTARLESEQMQHQITELRTERDRIREISKSLVPKSALMQAVKEAAELSAQVAKLRAEVPPESTMEALKDAVAKLQEVTTDRDRVLNELAAIMAEANKSGRCNGDPVALIKQGQNDLDALRSLERKYAASDALTANCKIVRDRWEKISSDCGRMDGEDIGEFVQRISRQSAHGVAKAIKYEELQVAHIKLQDEMAKATAKIKPLDVLYKTLKGYQDSDSIIGHGTIIEVAIDKATEALSQLTA